MQLPVFPPFVLVALVVFVCCLISAAIGILLTRAKFKKARIIIVLSFVGIITFYFLFYTVSNIVGRNSVREMWKKVESAGLSTKPEKIIPKDPNYYFNDKIIYHDTRKLSDNAVSLYEVAIELIKNSDVSNKRFDIFWKYQREKKSECIAPLYKQIQYDVPNWAAKDKAKAIELSKNKDVQQALECFARGNQKPYAVNLRYYTDIETDIQKLLPRLNHYREIFRMISFVSECYALEGKIDKAYDLAIDGLKFVHQFRNDPFIISHLVYTACTWIDLRTLNALVSRYGISSQKAQKIIEALNHLDCNKSMQKGLHGNLVLLTRSSFKERITGEMNYARTFFGKRKAFADYLYLYPFNYQEYAYYLDFWLKNYELYEKPYWEIKSQLEKLDKAKHQFLLMNNIANYLSSYRLKTARTNSLITVTKIILALHIYKNKHGNFPDKLDSLVPGILKKISVDAVSGKAYSYTKESKSFELTGFYTGKK